jgi:hypothetical protein
MIIRIRSRLFLLCLALLLALLPGCGSVAPQQPLSQQAAPQQITASRQAAADVFSFAVLSDPHSAGDSWINSLAEIKSMKVNPDPKYGKPEFIIVTGDTNPVDLRYDEFNGVFKGSGEKPVYLPVIGNHEADDNGGFPGGMGQETGPQGQGGGQPGMGMPRGAGGPPGQVGRSSSDGAVIQMPGNPPGMYPDTGDKSIIDMKFISDKIIASIPGAVRMSEKSCSYYYDYRNVRVISLDGFSGEAGTGGIINEKGRKWTEEVIKSAPATIDHIFIAFHAPAFPRVRHTYDSFNISPEQRNAFWNMLISHRDRVRAVFSGHTHYYARLRVLDPAGTSANDYNAYPDDDGGIYQVVVGSTGNGMKNTFLSVEIDGKNVSFRTYEAENGKEQPFAIKEEWSIIDNK